MCIGILSLLISLITTFSRFAPKFGLRCVICCCGYNQCFCSHVNLWADWYCISYMKLYDIIRLLWLSCQWGVIVVYAWCFDWTKALVLLMVVDECRGLMFAISLANGFKFTPISIFENWWVFHNQLSSSHTYGGCNVLINWRWNLFIGCD